MRARDRGVALMETAVWVGLVTLVVALSAGLYWEFRAAWARVAAQRERQVESARVLDELRRDLRAARRVEVVEGGGGVVVVLADGGRREHAHPGLRATDRGDGTVELAVGPWRTLVWCRNREGGR